MKKINQIASIITAVIMCCFMLSTTVSADMVENDMGSQSVSETLINNEYNLSEELSSGAKIISRKIISQDDENDIYIVETILTYDNIGESTVNPLDITYGTTTQSKVHEIYINDDYLVAKATLTASFKYDEESDYVSCTSKSKDMYVTSGSTTYFKDVELGTTSGGGIITKKYVTAYLSYGYGIAGATHKITIKCKSDGTIS